LRLCARPGRGAARVCRRRIAGEPEEEDDDDSLIEFIAASGQSADWVLFGDPGVMICKLAAGTLDGRSGFADRLRSS
jgi:hypothetical protein